MSNVPAVVFSGAEVEALNGAGPLALSVYFWLRCCMDYASGVVGQSSRISRQMLVDYCERQVTRGAGFQTEKPSLKDVRMAIDALVRAGLLVRRGGDVLVFFMPLAVTASVRSKQTGPVLGRVAGREQGREPGREPGTEPGTEPGLIEEGAEASSANGLQGVAQGEPGREPGLEPGTEPGRGAGTEPGRVDAPNWAYFRVRSKPVHSQPYVNSLSTVERAAPGAVSEQGGVLDAVGVVRVLADQAGMRLSASHAVVRQIAELAPRDDELAAAIVRCREIREREQSTAPLNPAFVRSNVLALRMAGRVRAQAGWRTDPSAAARYARALGLADADGRPGESMREFVARIAARALEVGHG